MPGRNDNAARMSAWRGNENFNVSDRLAQADEPEQSAQPALPELSE
jgi:hypothetical protein